MEAIAIILGIGIAAAIFLFMGLRQGPSDDSGTNFVWKILSLIVGVLLMVLLAWATTDAGQVCEIEKDLTNTTTSGYNLICFDGPMNQGSMFLRLMLVVTVIFFVWISVALFIMAVNHLRSTGKL